MSSFGDYVIARLSPERVDMCSFWTGAQESPHKLKSRLDVSPLSGEIAGFMRELLGKLDTLRLSGWAPPPSAPSGSGEKGMPISVDGPSWEIFLIEGAGPDFRVRDLRQYGEIGSLVNLIMDQAEETGARLPLVLPPVIGLGLVFSLHSHLEGKSRYYKSRAPKPLKPLKVLLVCTAWILSVSPVIWFGVAVLGFEAIDPQKGANWRSEARRSLPTHDRSLMVPTSPPNSALLSGEVIFPAPPVQAPEVVPDRDTALELAVAEVESRFGRKLADKFKPYSVSRSGDVWSVVGATPPGVELGGGSPEIKVSAQSGRIISIYLSK